MAENIIFIWDALKKYSNNIFYQSEKKSFSYNDFHNDIQAMIASLHPFVINKNERVAIIASDSYQTITLYFAVIALQAIPVLVSEKFPKLKLKELLASIDCQKIISEDIVTFNNSLTIKISFPDLNLNDTASIMFTSGTTALPKAVCHTFGNHYFSAIGSNLNIKVEPNDRWLLALPIHHIGGFSILFRTLIAGSTVVCNNSEYKLYDYINSMKISHLSIVETQLQKLTDDQQPSPDSLKALLVGGGKPSANTIKKAVDLGYPIFTTYGMTEMSSQITTTPPNSSIEKLKTSGQLLAHRELLIATDNEILVKGATLCHGYLNVHFPIDKNGWFKTNDLGVLNEDGSLTVIGRKDNMFVSGGENIYPEEIESLIKEIPSINDAVVVPAQSTRFGHTPVLFYTAKEACDVTDKTVADYLTDKIEKFKIPKNIYRFPENYIPLGIKPNRKFLIDYLLNK